MEQRLTQAAYKDRIKAITRSLMEHVGRKVLLIRKGAPTPVPVMATLKQNGSSVCAEYQQYDADGRPTARRLLRVDPRLMHTGEIEVEFFDDGV